MMADVLRELTARRAADAAGREKEIPFAAVMRRVEAAAPPRPIGRARFWSAPAHTSSPTNTPPSVTRSAPFVAEKSAAAETSCRRRPRRNTIDPSAAPSRAAGRT